MTLDQSHRGGARASADASDGSAPQRPAAPLPSAPSPDASPGASDARPSSDRPAPDHPSATRRRRLLGADVLVVVVAVLLALAGGYTATRLTPVTYEASAKVLLVPSPDGEASSAGQAADLVAAQVPTWAALAQTPAVVDPAVEASGLDVASTEAVDDVDATALASTSIIEVTAAGASAQDAAALASATATSLVDQVEQRSTIGGTALVSGSVVEQPAVPTTPASPRLVLNLAVALAVGLVVGLAVVVARRALVARRTS